MKIGIYINCKRSDGGIYHHVKNTINILEEFVSKDHELIYIFQSKDFESIIKKKKLNYININENFFYRLENFIYKFGFLKKFYCKFFSKSILERKIENNNIDLLYFTSPAEACTLISYVNYIIFLLSMQHKELNFFPEYKSRGQGVEIRDNIINKAKNYAFKILVGAEKDKNLLIKFYNADEKRIIVQPYTLNLPLTYEQNKSLEYQKIFDNLKIPNKKIFLYPAQFWAHKNHKYIIDAAMCLKKNNINDVYFIFCGFDKVTLNYINKLIIHHNLQDYFKIFNYLSDDELISIYLKCFSVIMPSYVGHTVIPMYECFYFKKNIFYTENLADKKLKEHITEIDIGDPDSVRKEYLKIISNPKENNIKLENARKYYDLVINNKIMGENYKKIFDEYMYIQERWK